MAEQNEIKKVITVDLGNTTTSLKEYKQHIDELRGALLQLDETSEDYQKIAQEVKQEQDKLNEVMKVGKGYTDAADGSYNQLVQTMGELKKQWRATADEAERADLGNQILEINNKLKDLDASTGNFQRNVGDYSNAFEEAFNNVLGNMQGIDGTLDVIYKDITRMIPLIKQTTKAATAGLNGVKKAIASTGIGALVVAVGLLVAHWNEVSGTVNKLNPATKRYNELLEETRKKVEQIRTEWNLANKQQDLHLQVMQAQGKSTLEQLEYIRDNSKQRLKDLEDANAGLVAGMEEAEKMIAKGYKAEELFNGQYTEKLKEYNEYCKQHLELTQQISDAEWNITLEDIKRQTDARNQAESDAKAAAENAKQQAQQRAEQRKKEAEDRKKQAEDIQKALEEANKDEVTKVREKYEEEKRLLEQHGIDTALLTQKYLDDVQKIFDRENEEIRQQQEEAGTKWFDESMSKLEQVIEQQLFELDLVNTTTLEQEAAVASQRYEIEKQLIEDKIALQEQFLQDYGGSLKDIGEAEQVLDNLKLELSNLDKTRAKETADYKKQMEIEASERSKIAWNSASKSVADILSNISDMMEDGSKEQKALAIMSTTINTLSGAISAYQSLASIPYVGPVLGTAAAAAVAVAGAANISKIKSTNKNSSSAAVTTPQVDAPSMTQVSPLLDEQNDLNRMTTLSEQGESQANQETRVYVVESDIREVGERVNVREENATF